MKNRDFSTKRSTIRTWAALALIALVTTAHAATDQEHLDKALKKGSTQLPEPNKYACVCADGAHDGFAGYVRRYPVGQHIAVSCAFQNFAADGFMIGEGICFPFITIGQ